MSRSEGDLSFLREMIVILCQDDDAWWLKNFEGLMNYDYFIPLQVIELFSDNHVLRWIHKSQDRIDLKHKNWPRERLDQKEFRQRVIIHLLNRRGFDD